MVEIRTILCPVDFSVATERQVSFATDLCRFFEAKLILHHNLNALGVGAGIGWMWSDVQQKGPLSEEVASRWLGRLMAEHVGEVRTEARLTHGPPTLTVLRVAELVNADLFVLTAHEGSHDEHMSMSEQILEQAKCAVVALHDMDNDLPRFSQPGRTELRVVVPVSFSETSAPAIAFTIDLARRVPLELHLLHIEQARRNHHEPDPARAADEERRLRGMLPADLGAGAHVHIATGDPASEIPNVAERLGANLIVMGEHSRTSLLRWFKRDTGRSILHRAHCPVWYVP